MGTKEALYRGREVDICLSDTELYQSRADMLATLPTLLATGVRMIKQNYGCQGATCINDQKRLPNLDRGWGVNYHNQLHLSLLPLIPTEF